MDNTIEASSRPASPVPSNHIGVGLPDLDKAVRWYHEVLGLNIVVNLRMLVLTTPISAWF
jgi:hypothetical protein